MTDATAAIDDAEQSKNLEERLEFLQQQDGPLMTEGRSVTL